MSRTRPRLRAGALAASLAAALLPVVAGPAAPAQAAYSAMVFPITGRVISDYGDYRDGVRSCPGGEHCGYDFAGNNDWSVGAPVYASYQGTVSVAGLNGSTCGSGYGYVIHVNHASGYQTRYAHLNSMVVSAGQSVQRGQLIGYEGKTGNACSTQPHLHYEILRNGTHVDLSNNGVTQTCTPSSAICYGQDVVAGNPIPYDFPGLSGSSPSPYYRDLARTPSGNGYWIAGSDGGVFSFGDAPFKGSLPGLGVNVGNIVGIAATPSGQGYWLVGADGGVFAFGDAPFKGSLPGLGISTNRIQAIVGSKTGNGYWLVQSDGGVFAFGDAPFKGALPGSVTVSNIVDIDRTPSGNGYVLVGADGGVFAFGDAPYKGSLPGISQVRIDIVGVAHDPDASGYWVVAADGAIYAFDAPYLGGANNLQLAKPVVGIDARPTGLGYWLVAGDGGVFAYGDAGFHGRP